MRCFFAIPVLLALLPALAPATVKADERLIGFWLTENKKAIVRTRVCGTKICGDMVWIANPLDAAGKAKLGADGKPLCGTQLIGDVVPGTDGWILDPRSGDKYSAAIKVMSQQAIKVRGYLGIKLFGSSQIWTRVADDRSGC